MSMLMKRNQGFSLLELLIVVAIILIIATIAIPSLLRSRQSAQESSAVAQLRTINTAEVTYLSSNQGAYGSLPMLITQGLLDLKRLYWNCRAFGSGKRKGRCPYQLLGVQLPTYGFWELLQRDPAQLEQELSTPRVAA